MGQQRPACHGLADGILGERITSVTEREGLFFETARSQKDVGRDDDVVLRHVLDDPVVHGVELPFDDHEVDPVAVWDTKPRVGNNNHAQAVSLGDAEGLLLYGTAIGIDEYVEHVEPRS